MRSYPDIHHCFQAIRIETTFKFNNFLKMSAVLVNNVMNRLQEMNMMELKGTFKAIITEEGKKFPFLKVNDAIVFGILDFLLEEGFQLTQALANDAPGCHVSLVLRREEDELDVRSLLLMSASGKVSDIYVRGMRTFQKPSAGLEFLVLQVEVPDLPMMRENMMLPKRAFGQEAHITLAQRPIPANPAIPAIA